MVHFMHCEQYDCFLAVHTMDWVLGSVALGMGTGMGMGMAIMALREWP